MIRLIKKNNFVYFSEKPREEKDLENTELLYTFEDLIMDEDFLLRVRPFMCIKEGKTLGYYKLELLDYIPDVLYTDPIPKETLIQKEELRKIIQDTKQFLEVLEIDHSWIDSNIKFYQIKYRCDIWNFFSDFYDPEICKKIRSYAGLNLNDKSQVLQLYQTKLKSRKLDIIRSANLNTIWEFISKDLQNELLIFGESEKVGKESSIPEYRIKDAIGPKYPDLMKEIYREFNLGEVFLDGANEIKDRLRKIYEKCGIMKTPKMKDLEEWFTMSGCWENGRRGVRINYRTKKGD